jgi:multisubunit Na+/H+ antiporter MnhB subunit
MRQILLTIPEVAFIAGTRGALGAGLGLLASGRMTQSRRRAIGWGLLAFGALATIPAAKRVLGQRSIPGERGEKLNGARGVVTATRGIPSSETPLAPQRGAESPRDLVGVI